MDSDFVLHIAREALETALLLSAPMLGAALLVGCLTAILQAVTSIRDATMGMVLKMVAVGLTALLAGNWMMQVAVKHANDVFQHVAMLGH